MQQPHLARQVILKNKEERRIVAGHPWAYSNEVRETRGTPGAGDVVELVAASGRSLGVGLYNPHSLIAFRLLSDTVREIDGGFFRSRISAARDLRERIYPEIQACRLVHGEADFLPGLVIDRYNDQLALQAFSYGMEQRLGVICEVLIDLFHPSAIVARNESPLRALENLPSASAVLYGEPSPTEITERGIRYAVDLREGQKTGFFLDQRENRALVGRLSGGCDVLDAFCNDGGFALSSARGGARSVLGIDISPEAVARAHANARLNSVTGAVFEEGDVFERLKSLAGEGRKFDLAVLDPPSFTRSRKNVQSAKKGYRNLHLGAFPLLRPGALLLTSSCSHHILPEVFREVVDGAARQAGRRLQLLEWRGAAPDHPVLPLVPETAYLKAGLYRVL